MKTFHTLLVGLLAAASSPHSVFAQSLPAAADTRCVELKIIETSDVHGHFFPYDFIEKTPIKGSLSRVNTYVSRQREKFGDNLLLIDNGDILQGQPVNYWSNFVDVDHENVAARVVNYMGYTAQTVGNHDIETGHAVYDKWIREVRCPALGANIVDEKSRQPYVKPYVVVERQGVRIAILGMITPTISSWLSRNIWSGLEFTEMVSTARYWVDRIKANEDADLIVGLFHSGWSGGICADGLEEDATERVAKEVDGFDIIFFGHDHQRHNFIVDGPKGTRVVCLDPSCYAEYVAEATITLELKGDEIVRRDIKGQLVSVADEATDEQMVSHFDADIQAVKEYVDRRIGRMGRAMTTRDCYFGPSSFTDFIHSLQLSLTDAEISFNAPLSFNTTIEEGEITVADMFKLYRFENNLCVVKMRGDEVRKHLEESYDRWVNTMQRADDHLLLLESATKDDQQRTGFKNYTFNFDSAAGIDYEVDVTKPNGKKVTILKMSDGTPFDSNRWYRVVMNSYRANGGGELLTKGAGIDQDSLESRIVYRSERDLRYYLMQEIERRGEVVPQVGNNWRFVPEKWTRPAAKRDRMSLFGRLD